MGIKVDMSGLENFLLEIENLQENMSNINEEFLKEESEKTVEIMQSYTPVGETGKLRDSYEIGEVKTEDKQTSIDISNTAYYASYVNYGTARQSPQYFIERGLNVAGEGIEERYKEKIKNALESGG